MGGERSLTSQRNGGGDRVNKPNCFFKQVCHKTQFWQVVADKRHLLYQRWKYKFGPYPQTRKKIIKLNFSLFFVLLYNSRMLQHKTNNTVL